MVYKERLGVWLHRNEFFKITGLTGWSFIYAAKSKSEIVLWYVVILSFVLLTIINVQQLVSHFASGPIRYSMLLRSDTSDIQLPNMTLKLNLPFIHYANELPAELGYQSCLSSGSGKPLLEYFCSAARNTAASTPGSLTKKFELNLLLELLEKLRKTSFGKLIVVNKTAQPVDLSNPMLLQKWETETSEAVAVLAQFWSNLERTSLDHCQVVNETMRLTNEPLAKRANDTILKLLALDSLKDGSDPRSKLIDPTKASSVKQILNAIRVTPRQLLFDVLSDLSKVIHVQLEPTGSISLGDWTATSARWAEYEFRPFEPRQQLTLRLVLPSGAKELTIKITSFVTMWLKKLVGAWQDVMHKKFGQMGCKFNSDHLETQIDAMLHEWSEYNIDEGSTTVSLENGDARTLYSGYSAEIIVSPSLLFTSKLQSCIRGAHATCIDHDCPRSRYQTDCDCVPWTHSVLTEDERICDGSCPSSTSDQCKAICGNDVERRCAMLLLRSSLTNEKNIMHVKDHFESNIFSIRFSESVNYVEVVAEYEMVLSTFFSLLGGAVEFWGALSISALIHLLIYSINKCCVRSQKPPNPPKSKVDIQHSLEELEAQLQTYEKIVWKQKDNFSSWLWGNRFYECTPLLGYGYISAARTKTEAVFCYFIIISFTIAAGVHLYIVVDNFSSSAPHFETKPSVLPDVGIPNITLELKLPFAELTSNIFQIQPLYELDVMQSEQTLIEKYVEIRDDRILNGLKSVEEVVASFSNSLSHYLRNQTINAERTIRKTEGRTKNNSAEIFLKFGHNSTAMHFFALTTSLTQKFHFLELLKYSKKHRSEFFIRP